MSGKNMKVKRIISFICLVTGLAVFPFNVFAWDGAGHMVIAAEAFRQLSPELKAQAIEVLKAHPDYAKWVKAYYPNPTIDLAEYAFMRSSTWPDEIRGTGNEYDHPEWHFIDYPLRPPSFPFEPDARPTNNVLFGIGQCEMTLSDTNANPELRAIYLSYLIHLIGDLHQPLHCASLFTAVYPDGDRGGNDFYVKPEDVGVRLHGIWDGLLGTSLNPRTDWEDSLKLEAAHPRNSLPKLKTDTTPKEWSLESRELAIRYGYLNGTLKGGTNSESAPPLPPGYLKNATGVAELQGALAGCRLADEIQTCLKLGRLVPLLPPNTNTVARHLPAVIGTAQASDYYDEDMMVTGKVVQVSIGSKVALLSLDKPFPDSPFTVVIFKENLGRFGDLQTLKNQDVTVSGTITQYHDKPEMILETAGQLKTGNHR
jgi:hypothetical protein